NVAQLQLDVSILQVTRFIHVVATFPVNPAVAELGACHEIVVSLIAIFCGCQSLPSDARFENGGTPQPAYFPLPTEAGKASLPAEELLHRGLLQVALLGDESVQPVQERVHVAQCRRDSA